MSPSPELDKARRDYNNYLRYTGLGFTMIGIVLVCCFGGWWLDGLIGWKYPVLTILLSLIGIAGAMFHLFKETGRR
jgi:F0F1-type ATP synthase assembly protein I